jgi:predicted CoA-binding protein
MDYREHLIEDERSILAIAGSVHRVAVLGIKSERQADQPAFRIPEYLDGVGLDVVPVPVYYPEVTEILGKPVYRRLVDIPGGIDLVDVFRRPQDIPQHVDDIIAKQPRYVWFQLGIRNDEAAEQLARAGINVVQDRCLMVDHRRAAASLTR